MTWFPVSQTGAWSKELETRNQKPETRNQKLKDFKCVDKKVAGWKLGRNTSHRRALLRNLVTSLIMEERIETTVPKAKAMRLW